MGVCALLIAILLLMHPTSSLTICNFYSTKTSVGDSVDLVAALLCHSKNFATRQIWITLHCTAFNSLSFFTGFGDVV